MAQSRAFFLARRVKDPPCYKPVKVFEIIIHSGSQSTHKGVRLVRHRAQSSSAQGRVTTEVKQDG